MKMQETCQILLRHNLLPIFLLNFVGFALRCHRLASFNASETFSNNLIQLILKGKLNTISFLYGRKMRNGENNRTQTGNNTAEK